MLLGIIGLSILIPVLIVAILVLRRKKAYPEKNLFNAFLNIALGPMRALRLGPYKQGSLTIDKGIKLAIKKKKFSPEVVSDTAFAENYRTVTETDTHKSLVTSNLGYILMQLEINLTVARRFKFLQYITDVPDVLNVPVRSPLFVTGLPRTGTTFLHRLLSLDPAVRAPLLWELLASTPSVKGESSEEFYRADREKRAKYVRKLIKQRKQSGDKSLDHIHEIEADLPEECLMALADEIPLNLCYFYSIILNWQKFFGQIDHPRVVAAFKYYKKVLQLLSYQLGERENPRRWVLKCPIHLYYIKQIAEVFPDAKIVWTHRHPQSAVPSMCSLVKAVHASYYENECRDDALIGRSVCDLSAQNLVQAPKDMEAANLPCSNVIYNDLIKDPISVVKSIYQQFGWKYTTEYEKIIEAYLEEDRKKRESMKKKGRSQDQTLHTYSPEEFSLTTEELSTGAYAEYIKKFNIPLSTN